MRGLPEFISCPTVENTVFGYSNALRCHCKDASGRPIPSTVPLADRKHGCASSHFLCWSRAGCPKSQMSAEGLRNDSCCHILNVHHHIPRSVERDEVTFAAAPSSHPLVSSLCVSTMPLLVSCPAVTMKLHRVLVCLPGQTSCCVWHSSFIDGLFFNCSRRMLSFSAATLTDPWGWPSYWGPTFTLHTGSTTVDL